MRIRSIKANAILNIIYTITNIIFPLITFPYVSRILSANGMGKVSFFSAVASYATMFGSLGISTYGIRAVAKVRDNKQKLSEVTAELFIINSVISIIVTAALALSIPFVVKFQTEPSLFIINCILIIASPIGINWFYSGLEQYDYITKRTIAFKILSLLLVFALIHEKSDYKIYAGITIFSSVSAYVCNFLYARKFVQFKRGYKLHYKQHFKPMLLLFASILAVSVYTNLDTIMLGFISGDTQVGLYTVAVKVQWLLLAAVNAISAVLLPRLSYYLSQNDKEKYNRILKKSMSVIFMIAIPLTLYFIVEAKDSIMFLGGKGYLGAILCMQIIMPTLIISGFSNITGNQVLIPRGDDSKFMMAVIVGALADLVFNLILMPKYGCIGAAVATLAAETAQMSIQFHFAKRDIIRNFNKNNMLKIMLAGIAATLITVLIRNIIDIDTIINLIITAAVYFGIYGILLLILKDEVALELIKERAFKK